MDPSNSIYYTLSTIAQVLAAFLALSGVFVIGKLKEYTDIQLNKLKLILVQFKKIDECRFNQDVLKIYMFNLESIRLISESNIPKDSFIHIDKILDDLRPDISHEIFRKYFNDLSLIRHIVKQLQEMKDILKLLSISSILIGVVVISYSLIVLANTHTYFVKDNSSIILSIAIFLAIISILFMVVSIIMVITDYNDLKYFPKVVKIYRKFSKSK